MDDEALIGIIIFGGGFMVAIIAIVTSAVRKTIEARAKEQTRREIAAYIAEGSISPDDGVRLLEAGGGAWTKIKEMAGR